MMKIIKGIERLLIGGILIVFCTILVLSFVDLVYVIYLDVIDPPYLSSMLIA